VHVIDNESQKVVANVMVAARPRGLAFNSTGKRAYVTSEIGNEITQIDTETWKIVNTKSILKHNSKPMAVTVSPDDKTIFVTLGRGNALAIMDADTLDAIAAVDTGRRVWGNDVTRDGKLVFTADGMDGTVSVVDTENQERIKTIDVGAYPWGVVIDD
jgi:YVTN family beta-propeller protein